ncbi:cbb3-type cytochrome oxidase assembly protein CcoS [Campylobacter sp. JMF_01 NE2]|uniref:cbb3-type cytochrome oxidase assembly protein CcoS n=1 Tax=unclassified Campylobacter TaxID=2593542 RepID=UPI001B72ECEC|nr:MULTISPECIES: cbb3-type cytochrome oxidase assembly protein CcoS [unclassified Campylobacter]MBP3224194.1 cbb3-type cytochrome oxidase assembly protein CcoS [Campylobacter sp.]MDA3042582.1 cbb3-type cytochrome oxidase assembly protein CcoS [Campylobacter sp. JMF_09 ED2]MDA3044604.1 cbb3-type cytochrome oxidase assembly protein CcoS [Campylobacter sp. JMF_07 ED4]MDA3046305.1 cbb3-type cytochrome oxidase assembly protein CcoS [Campylobacter sp. VBCF_06 NA8]MDA3047198.1 cbb3-type cytochrome ox
MSNAVLMTMVTISLILGFCVLGGLLWALKNHQFDDYSKFLGGTEFDGEDALNEAVKMEEKRKEALRRKKENLDS